LKTEEIATIKKSAKRWSGIKGIIKSIEYRHDDNDYYVEINIICEDETHFLLKNKKFRNRLSFK